MNFTGGTVFAVSSDCGSQGAAAYDPPSHDPVKKEHGVHCWLVTAPPVIIGDTYMSMKEGFIKANDNCHTKGDQPACPECNALEGPRYG